MEQPNCALDCTTQDTLISILGSVLSSTLDTHSVSPANGFLFGYHQVIPQSTTSLAFFLFYITIKMTCKILILF